MQKGQESFELTAPCVISSAGVINTFKKLLPREVAEKTGKKSPSFAGVDSGLAVVSGARLLVRCGGRFQL